MIFVSSEADFLPANPAPVLLAALTSHVHATIDSLCRRSAIGALSDRVDRSVESERFLTLVYHALSRVPGLATLEAS